MSFICPWTQFVALERMHGATSPSSHHIIDTRRALSWPFFRSEVGRGKDRLYTVDFLIDSVDDINRILSIHVLTVLLEYVREAASAKDFRDSVHFCYKHITVRSILLFIVI